MHNDYLLFKKGELYHCIRHLKETLKEEIYSQNSEYLLNVSVYDFTQHLISKYYLDCPKIERDKIYIDNQREVNIDVRHDSSRDIRDRSKPFYIQGTEISIAIPFTGNSILFDYQPSTYSINRPRGIIRKNEIVIAIQQNDHNANEIKQCYSREVGIIEQYLSWIEKDIKSYNESLESTIKQIIDIRKNKLIADKGLLSDIGLPIKKRENAPQTYTVPLKIKKPLIRRPIVSEKTYKPEPILADQEYEEILSIIHNMVLVMERSPRAFSSMHEEDFRQHFLVQLNGQYQGQATGETFNYNGKTDILIRVEDKNIFIAECKFWKGEKSLLSTINQLFTYTSWRDTKIAILLFNRNYDFSSVLKKISSTVKSHRCYKSELKIEETKFRYLFHMPDDPNRELILSILAFNVPSSKK